MNILRKIISSVSGEYKFAELSDEVKQKVLAAIRDQWLGNYISVTAIKETPEQIYAANKEEIDEQVVALASEVGYDKDGNVLHGSKDEDKEEKKTEKEQKKQEKEKDKAAKKEKTVTEQAIDFIAKAMLPKKDGGMGMSFADAQAEAYKKFGKGVEKEAIEKLDPSKKKEEPKKKATFKERVLALNEQAREHYRKASKEPSDDDIINYIVDSFQSAEGIYPNKIAIRRILSSISTGTSEPSKENPVAICPKCKDKVTKNELENFGGICAECWEESKRNRANLSTLNKGNENVKTLEEAKKQAQRNRLLAVLNKKSEPAPEGSSKTVDASVMRERLAAAQLVETRNKLEQTKRAHRLAKLAVDKGMVDPSNEDGFYSKLIVCNKEKFEAVELLVEEFKPVQRGAMSLRSARIASLKERLSSAPGTQLSALPGGSPEDELSSLDKTLEDMFQ